MGKIARNFFYNVAYQILVLVTPIVTAPYLTRVLGAENLGIYSYISSSGNIISTISLLGIYAYGNRQIAYVREDKSALTSTFWELMAARIGLGIVGTAFYIIYAFYNHEFHVFFLIYYPYILAQFIDCSWVYVGMENMKPAVMKNFIARLINVAGIFIFVKSENDISIYIGMLAVTTLVANISIYTQLHKYIEKPKGDVRKIPHHLKGAIALFLPQVASLFYLQMDKVMLEWITGSTRQVSFYDQAEKIVTIPLSFITTISTVIMPRLANEYYKNSRKMLGKTLLMAGRYALCIAMPMMFGMFSIARQFIPWYLGIEFHSSVIAVMILSPILLSNSLTGISGSQYFTATNQMGILLKAYVTAAIMNVIVNILLIPKWGYVGAAVATVISSMCSVIIQYTYLAKQVHIRKLKSYGCKYFAGAVLMALGISGFSMNMPASAETTLMQIFIGILIYIVYLAVTRDYVIKQLVAYFFLFKRQIADRRKNK